MKNRKIILYFIVYLIFISTSCELNKKAIDNSKQWNKNSDYSSMQIRAEASETGEDLQLKIAKYLKTFHFEKHSESNNKIVTEKLYLANRFMRLTISYSENIVTISGEDGIDYFGNGIAWKPIRKGNSLYGSIWWERMHVVTYAIAGQSGLTFQNTFSITIVPSSL